MNLKQDASSATLKVMYTIGLKWKLWVADWRDCVWFYSNQLISYRVCELKHSSWLTLFRFKASSCLGFCSALWEKFLSCIVKAEFSLVVKFIQNHGCKWSEKAEFEACVYELCTGAAKNTLTFCLPLRLLYWGFLYESLLWWSMVAPSFNVFEFSSHSEVTSGPSVVKGVLYVVRWPWQCILK